MKKFLLFFLVFIYTVFPQAKPYVILVSIDAFRWDYINRGITPALSQIKEEGVSAISLQSAFPTKTFPNHLSIITGMYTENHGIISNDFINLFTGERYKLGDTVSTREYKWYLGEAFWETAKRSGIKTACYFWPASEVLLEQKHPDYYKKYDKKTTDNDRVDGVIEWLKLPYKDRPHFITLYFDIVDTRSHEYGPDAKETNESIKGIDSVIARLKNSLSQTGLKDSVNLIILSDHGMTGIDKNRSINVEQIINDPACKIINTGPVALLHPAANNIKAVYEKMKKNENHYKVYYKEEVPESYHYSKHPFIPEIVAIADLGWEFIDNRIAERQKTGGGKLGNHGFDNHQLDMHGFFVAGGPLFKKHYATGTLLNIDIYPLLCRIFNIQPRSNIDGKAERIEFILNNN